MRNARSQPEAAIEVGISVASGPREEEVADWAAALLRAAGRRGARLSILMCGDGRMKRLNRTWRRKDGATDVLSFPSGEKGVGVFLGDIAIDVPYALRQAERGGHSLRRETQILLAHGLLHLLGYDHEADEGEMFARQRALVRKVFGPGPSGVPEGRGKR